MSERWIEESEQLLRRMRELSSKEKKDRLEIINSIIFVLNLLKVAYKVRTFELGTS